jgi:LacI family transcriptional regulator
LRVHVSTISMALRQHPRISQAMRKRVQEKARKMGYRPDPVLQSLQSYVRKSRTPRAVATIALVVFHKNQETWLGHYSGKSYMEGFQRRANELGFVLEPFYLSLLRGEGKDLDRILRARGIRTVLLAPAPAPLACHDLPWEHYSAVAVGYSIAEPALHRVVPHYRFAVKTTIQELRRLGYRRFALAYSPEDELRLQDGWTSGFWVEQARAARDEHFFMYRQRIPRGGTSDRENYFRELKYFQAWLSKNRPEVILGGATWVPSFLKKLNLRLPHDVGFVHLSRPPDEPRYTGIDQQLDQVGAAAIDLLGAMVHQHEFGLPQVPKIVVIEGRWVTGQTVRHATRIP